jgi:hypothetical protein
MQLDSKIQETLPEKKKPEKEKPMKENLAD